MLKRTNIYNKCEVNNNINMYFGLTSAYIAEKV